MPTHPGEVVHFPQPRGALHPPRRGTIDPWVWLLALALLVCLVSCSPDESSLRRVSGTNGPRLGNGVEETEPPRQFPEPPRVEMVGGVLSSLDTLAARVESLDGHRLMGGACDAACVAGVASVTVKAGALTCRCVRLPSLGRAEVTR